MEITNRKGEREESGERKGERREGEGEERETKERKNSPSNLFISTAAITTTK